MIRQLEHLPAIDVQDAEYARLLGYPRNWVLEGRALELASWARAWYADHGRPWIFVRHANRVELRDSAVVIEGAPFSSRRLMTTLRQAEAHAVALAAVSAGAELEAEAHRLWLDDRPDEYFFLEVFGSAVVEHLTALAGARLCAWADEHGVAVLPHTSPGYAEWDVAEQPRLLELVRPSDGTACRAPLEALDSGMLRPKKSLLAVFGITDQVDRVRSLAGLVPCENCSLENCQYRRTPYLRPPASSQHELAAEQDRQPTPAASAPAPLNLEAQYAVNIKALQRWSADRLSLSSNANGTTDARFRYEGATCTNMGRVLAFDYIVKLGVREAGYPIQDELCAPVAGHDGYTNMCGYIDDRDRLMRALELEKPLLGQRLDDVLSWTWPPCSAGCHCEAPSRAHKWGLVLETIHFALAQLEREGRRPPTAVAEGQPSP